MEFSPAQRLALARTDDLKPLMAKVGDTIWHYAEVGPLEARSARYLTDLLEKEGFSVTRGTGGFPTGFIAEYRRGTGPVAALLCEYDALPALSCTAEGGNGHGCGHNLFSAAAIGCALAVKAAMEQTGIKGTLRVYGTPGEENFASKAYYVNQGLFDDVDFSVGFHAHDRNRVNYDVSAGTLIQDFIFHGRSAHAGECPWEGRSALDAAEIMNVACNYLREHVTPDVRIQYAVSSPAAYNVVPDLASCRYCIRAASAATMEEVNRRVTDCANGAALASGCTCEIRYLDRTYNTVLLREYAQLAQSWLEAVGPPAFSREELEASRAFGDGSGLDTHITPLPSSEGYLGGATDEGDVSWVVPHVSIYVANMARGTVLHTLDATRQANMPAAYTAMAAQVKATSCMLLDLLEHPEKAAALKAAHARKMGGLHYPKDPGYRPDPSIFAGMPADL